MEGISFKDKVYKAELGKLHIFFTGQAGFIVKFPNGKLLGIDLYLSDIIEKETNNRSFKRLIKETFMVDEIPFDYLITTHHHHDHFDYDSIPYLMDNECTKLFMPKDCESDANKLGIDMERVCIVNPGFTFNDGENQIKFINCDHGKSAPNAIGVIISSQKKNIVIVGDSRLRLDRKKEYISMGKPDVLIAPINGTFGNMNDLDLALLSIILKPKLTIPCHYGMFSSQMGNPGRFSKVMNHLSLPYIFMAIEEQYTLI